MERLAAHEAFEMALLQWLRSAGLLRALAFGGGTMLRLCHELPRYSLDMDFWFLKAVDFDGFYHRLQNSIQQEYDVSDIQSKESGPRGPGFGAPRRGDYVCPQCSPLPLRFRRDLRQVSGLKVLGFRCRVSGVGFQVSAFWLLFPNT